MPKLFMLLIGSSPPNRNIEQHDIFFGIGEELKDLVPSIKAFWPEAKEKIHIDAWREVCNVDGHSVSVVEKEAISHEPLAVSLFFLNLGGYKQDEFEEFHYKMIVAAADKAEAINKAKQTAFYKHTGFKGATSHIDDKYGVDVDDMFEIKDILSAEMKSRYRIIVEPGRSDQAEDEIHLGYYKLDKILAGNY